MDKTIVLDCAPGYPRPGDLIEDVMADSGVKYDGRAPISKLFGSWQWDFSDVPDAEWLKAKPVFKARIEALYHAGTIRYGSW